MFHVHQMSDPPCPYLDHSRRPQSLQTQGTGQRMGRDHMDIHPKNTHMFKHDTRLVDCGSTHSLIMLDLWLSLYLKKCVHLAWTLSLFWQRNECTHSEKEKSIYNESNKHYIDHVDPTLKIVYWPRASYSSSCKHLRTICIQWICIVSYFCGKTPNVSWWAWLQQQHLLGHMQQFTRWIVSNHSIMFRRTCMHARPKH